ncbi:GNAT family N-acetyltransferase [Longispora albida]|uniref:GNAT family N-acetyltransferase n=1 Tax=Longispora albida TaxID=203523 RepID=UPI0006864F2F|nr:GNAT family N-acetyltransferase [Longispora albida]
MHVTHEPDVGRFAGQVLPWLGQDPVRNNVASVIVQSRAEGQVPVENGAVWLSVRDGAGELAAVAVRTPPLHLLISGWSEAAAGPLAEWYAAYDPALTAVGGPVELSDAFALRWNELTGAVAGNPQNYRGFRLDEVITPKNVSGTLRKGELSEEELILGWVGGFFAEAAPHEDPAGLLSTVRRKLETGAIEIWEDGGEPVSMLWTSAPAAGVVRISGVFTPAANRGHGYASGMVAAVSEQVLASGHVPSLFTDQANPTSNKIYQAIGYRPVMDTRLWMFSGR